MMRFMRKLATSLIVAKVVDVARRRWAESRQPPRPEPGVTSVGPNTAEKEF
jgi:hypothetical protein